MTNAEAWFSIALRPRKPEGSLGRTAQDCHLDSHTAPELCALSNDSTPGFTVAREGEEATITTARCLRVAVPTDRVHSTLPIETARYLQPEDVHLSAYHRRASSTLINPLPSLSLPHQPLQPARDPPPSHPLLGKWTSVEPQGSGAGGGGGSRAAVGRWVGGDERERERETDR